MRGLDTRVALALTRILKLVDPVAGDEAIWDAAFESETDGYHDAAAGFYQLPAQFVGEPLLIQGWNSGQNAYHNSAEMAECSTCNDHTGNPCHIHG